jgi:hypothetical protein
VVESHGTNSLLSCETQNPTDITPCGPAFLVFFILVYNTEILSNFDFQLREVRFELREQVRAE